ncbi:ERAD-associated protein [Coemansia sp. RSA 1933]|nr:ERAD-associated protein [Coemansia sp. RSA 1933]
MRLPLSAIACLVAAIVAAVTASTETESLADTKSHTLTKFAKQGELERTKIAAAETERQRREFRKALDTLEKYQAYVVKQQKKRYRGRESMLKTTRSIVELLPQPVRSRMPRFGSKVLRLFGDSKESDTWYTPRDTRQSAKVMQAIETIRELADSGSEDAAMAAADMEMYGKYGTEADLRKAFEGYRMVAETSGSARAQYMVGLFYATGLGGIEQRNSLALLYNTLAAKRGYAPAEMMQAFRHLTGVGVPESCEDSLAYYQSVARKAISHYLSGPPLGRAPPPYRARLSDDNSGAYGVRTGPYSLYKINDRAAFEEILDYHMHNTRKGDIKSSITLVDLYYHGHRFAPRSHAVALIYIRQIIGRLFTKRGELRKDLVQEEVNAAAQAAGMYGLMHLRGEGVPTDAAMALKWLTVGANMGHGASLNALGFMYQKGIEVPVNSERAIDLFKRAVEKKHQGGQVNYAMSIIDTHPQIGLTNLKSAAVSGHILANFHLAEIYTTMYDPETSCRMAVASYKVVAEHGDWLHSPIPDAYTAYERGDLKAATIEYARAAEMGYSVGQLNAALLLERAAKECQYRDPNAASVAGRNASQCRHSVLGNQQQHERQTLAYWTRAANQHMPDARSKQGDHFYYGWGVERSPEKAAAAYLISAKADSNGLAMWNLGWMYENGVGLKRDFYMAKRWYDRSIEANEGGKLAANLSLFRLCAKYLWAWMSGEDVGETPLFFSPTNGKVDGDDDENDDEEDDDNGHRTRKRENDAAAAAPANGNDDDDDGNNAYAPDDWEQGAAAAAAIAEERGANDDDTAEPGLEDADDGSLTESIFMVVLLLAAAWMFLPFR